jgi:hypothetical protein
MAHHGVISATIPTPGIGCCTNLEITFIFNHSRYGSVVAAWKIDERFSLPLCGGAYFPQSLGWGIRRVMRAG